MNNLRHIVAVALWLVSISAIAGEYADAFILTGVHPRIQAMGQSTVALPVDYGHAINNPAGLIFSRSHQMNLSYDQFNGLSTTLVAEGQLSLGSQTQLGLTLLDHRISDLYARPDLYALDPVSRRDSVLNSGNIPADPIAYHESALFISVGKMQAFEINLGWKFFKIPIRVPYGLSMKLLDKLLVENRGLGIGFDAGFQVLFNLGGMSSLLKHTEFSLGYMFHDLLNTPVYWETEHQDAIDRGLVRGLGIQQSLPSQGIMVAVGSSVQSRLSRQRQYGIELTLRELLMVRLGHDGKTPSFGLGIALKKFIIDYTFSQHELSGMQKIGVNYRF